MDTNQPFGTWDLEKISIGKRLFQNDKSCLYDVELKTKDPEPEQTEEELPNEKYTIETSASIDDLSSSLRRPSSKPPHAKTRPSAVPKIQATSNSKSKSKKDLVSMISSSPSNNSVSLSSSTSSYSMCSPKEKKIEYILKIARRSPESIKEKEIITIIETRREKKDVEPENCSTSSPSSSPRIQSSTSTVVSTTPQTNYNTLAINKISPRVYHTTSSQSLTQFTQQEEQQIQYLQELHLKHQYIIRFLSAFETENQIFIIMEKAKGRDLLDYIKLNGPLSEKQAARVLQKIIYAVQYLHSCSIVHRDIKLENILLMIPNDLDSVKLTDFDFATHYSKNWLIQNQHPLPPQHSTTSSASSSPRGYLSDRSNIKKSPHNSNTGSNSSSVTSSNNSSNNGDSINSIRPRSSSDDLRFSNSKSNQLSSSHKIRLEELRSSSTFSSERNNSSLLNQHNSSMAPPSRIPTSTSSITSTTSFKSISSPSSSSSSIPISIRSSLNSVNHNTNTLTSNSHSSSSNSLPQPPAIELSETEPLQSQSSSPQLIEEPFLTERVGTREYFSPELIRGKYHGPEVDTWALGVCLYSMLTNQFPFQFLTDQSFDLNSHSVLKNIDPVELRPLQNNNYLSISRDRDGSNPSSSPQSESCTPSSSPRAKVSPQKSDPCGGNVDISSSEKNQSMSGNKSSFKNRARSKSVLSRKKRASNVVSELVSESPSIGKESKNGGSESISLDLETDTDLSNHQQHQPHHHHHHHNHHLHSQNNQQHQSYDVSPPSSSPPPPSSPLSSSSFLKSPHRTHSTPPQSASINSLSLRKVLNIFPSSQKSKQNPLWVISFPSSPSLSNRCHHLLSSILHPQLSERFNLNDILCSSYMTTHCGQSTQLSTSKRLLSFFKRS